MKHNKKRNTAFVFETLVKEITAAIIKNDHERKDKAVSIVKKHFKPGSALRQHLNCYKSLYCLLYTSPSPRDNRVSRMPSSA